MTRPDGITGYGPDVCPHCGNFVGQSYWTHRALVHPELNPPPPRPEKPTKGKRKK